MLFDKTYFISNIKDLLGSFVLFNSQIFEIQDFSLNIQNFQKNYHNSQKFLEEKKYLKQKSLEYLDLLKSPILEKNNIVLSKIMERGLDDWCSFVIINVGENQNIKTKDIVVYFNYDICFLVGQVVEVYQNYSKVLLVSDIKSNVSCFVPSKNIYGVLFGNNKYILNMKLIEYKKNNNLELGDKVFTSGLGGVFQSGIYIGEISSIKRNNNGNIEKVLVDLYDEFMKLRYVFVIKN